MKCKILHEARGHMRVHLVCGRMTLKEADILEYYLRAVDGVKEVKVYDRTQDAIIVYQNDRTSLIRALATFSFAKAESMELVPDHTARALNREFEDKLVFTVLRRAMAKMFFPAPIRMMLAIIRSAKYIKEGVKALLHGHLSVAVLDATAVTVSLVRGDFDTAGSASARSSRSGRTKSLLPTSRAPCPSMSIRSGSRRTAPRCSCQSATFRRATASLCARAI